MGLRGAGGLPAPTPPTHIQVEALMSALVVPVPTQLEHRWELRLEEFEDGHSFRRFECVDCGAVRYE